MRCAESGQHGRRSCRAQRGRGLPHPHCQPSTAVRKPGEHGTPAGCVHAGPRSAGEEQQGGGRAGRTGQRQGAQRCAGPEQAGDHHRAFTHAVGEQSPRQQGQQDSRGDDAEQDPDAGHAEVVGAAQQRGDRGQAEEDRCGGSLSDRACAEHHPAVAAGRARRSPAVMHAPTLRPLPASWETDLIWWKPHRPEFCECGFHTTALCECRFRTTRSASRVRAEGSRVRSGRVGRAAASVGTISARWQAHCRGKSGLHRAGWLLTATRGDPRDSATENRPPARALVRVKRCGKSAPASRATGAAR